MATVKQVTRAIRRLERRRRAIIRFCGNTASSPTKAQEDWIVRAKLAVHVLQERRVAVPVKVESKSILAGMKSAIYFRAK